MFKNLKPTTPSLRHNFALIKKLNKSNLLKNKIKNYKQSLGRSYGKIVSRHKERGAKKKYRILSTFIEQNIEGIVCSIEHDPYRSGFIMSVFDAYSNKFFYLLAQNDISIGDKIHINHKNVSVSNGNQYAINRLRPGTLISNVPLNTNSGGKIARAAGSYCLIKGHLDKFCFLELMSGEIRLVPSTVLVSIGKISNDFHFLEQKGKAGKSRWKGCRPKTRGVAMNPVDHPNGGGEGKKSGKGKTPWGRPGKGVKTSNTSSKLVIKKRNE